MLNISDFMKIMNRIFKIQTNNLSTPKNSHH